LVHSRVQNLKFSVIFKSAGENKKKNKEKQDFLRKMSTKPVLVFGVTLKKITVDTCNFH